ncbi:MAG: hypothetical protein DRO40_09760 [Thermoprotei archaeon]|nr:MAG: hypothetical protein DRO40_09760 [Thermoprotei archaeon]
MARGRGIPRTPEEIVESYKPGVESGIIKYQKKTALMVKKAQRVAEATRILGDIRKLLDRYGIYGTDRIKYLNLARRIWHCMNRYSDEALRACARKQVASALQEGCDPTIVDAIVGAFGISLGGGAGGAGAPPI